MSIFAKSMGSSQNSNGGGKASFENLTKFFEEVRRGKKFSVEDSKVKKLKEDVENLFENTIPEIVLNDYLIDKDMQKNLLKDISNSKFLFNLSINEPWNFNKKRVVVAGRFSAGKSSVINKLINRNVLPTNVRPTTAISTQITNIGGKTHSIVKTINHSDPKIVNTEVLKHLVKEEMEKFPIHLADVIEYIVINDTSLGDDIVIVDTPGFDPADKKNLEKDKKLMEREFNDANCIVWVMDIADGDISRDALEVLKNIKDKELIVVVNKADTKPSSEIEKVLNKVKDTLIKNNIKYLKIISIGRNTYNLNFDKNTQLLRDLIKNIPIPQFNIFEEIKEFLKTLYNETIYVEKYHREAISRYENIKTQMEENDDTGDFLHSINKLNKKDELLKEINNLIRNLANENTKIKNFSSQLDRMWKTEYPMFGDDKYYILIDELDKFLEIQLNLHYAYWREGYYYGIIFEIISNEIIRHKNELQKIDEYISKINRALKEIESIENLYKKYQLTKMEEKTKLN